MAWVEQWVGHCACWLGLGDWVISVKVDPTLDSDVIKNAHTQIAGQYYWACILIPSELPDNHEGRELIVHELLHVRLSHLTLLCEQAFDSLNPQACKLAHGVASIAEDITVTSLAEALTPLLESARPQ